MARMVSIHEYELRPDVNPSDFERAVCEAERRGLFALPGLVEHRFLKGVKGARQGAYTAVWVFESREAWERLWGRVDRPRAFADYPPTWKTWESEVLARFLDRDPDTIRFTSYEELSSS